MRKKSKEVCWGLGLSLVFAACLFNTSQFFVVGSRVCVDGKEFIKTWSGDGLSTVTNIVIKDSVSGHIYYNDGLPANHVNDITGLVHGQTLNITWTDWRGPQAEQETVWCTDGVDRLTNTIPSQPPKSMQTPRFGLRLYLCSGLSV